MGAWNYSLVGSDHVQDSLALFETADWGPLLETLRVEANREMKNNERNPDQIESYEIETFVGSFYQLAMDGVFKEIDIDELMLHDFKACFKELETNKIILQYGKSEERFLELKKAREELKTKGFNL